MFSRSCAAVGLAAPCCCWACEAASLVKTLSQWEYSTRGIVSPSTVATALPGTPPQPESSAPPPIRAEAQSAIRDARRTIAYWPSVGACCGAPVPPAAVGVGSTAVSIWNIAKWPVLLAVVVTMFAVLFYAAPNVKLTGFRWVTPGALLAIVLWLIASAAFAFYVANFGSYDKTYGALGSVVCLLVWFWITNVALLLGMELNSERERGRELAAGVRGADRELQLDARSAPKRQQTT